MNLLNLLTLFGGLALFLYGMHLLGEGLSRLSGGRMETILSRMTDNPLKGVLLGAGITAIIQSSSATTVMVVGLVNSGILQLQQTVGIIMGANIGTTITSWLLSLSGIKGDHLFLTLLKPKAFSPVLAMIGVIFFLFCQSQRKKDTGSILLGFAILMSGMDTMSSSVEPLKNIPEFTNLFLAFSNPVLGMLAGTVLTAIVQSSSASIGILQALCVAGTIPYAAVFPIILGQNIGTCITALLSSIGASTNARRAAFIHLYFNLIGTVVFMTIFYSIHYFYPFPFFTRTVTPAGIAVIHSCFNLFATIILFPFSRKLVTLACISVSEKDTTTLQVLPAELSALSNMDKRFLENPPFALAQCRKTIGAMLALAKKAAFDSLSLIFEYSKESASSVEELENYVDRYENEINDYMFKISLSSLSESDLRELSVMQHSVGHIERIADYALGIVISIHKIEKKKLKFSKDAERELSICSDIVHSIINDVIKYWENSEPLIADDVWQLETELSHAEKKIMKNHKNRVKKGKCGVDMGFILADILSSLGKIAEHSLHIIDAVQTAHAE